MKIFTNSIFKHIVQETIQYAIYCRKHSFNINVSKMKKFYAINIIMAYIKYPNYRLYWSLEASLQLPIIAKRMCLKRFEEIKGYLHYKNNSEIPNGCEDIL